MGFAGLNFKKTCFSFDLSASVSKKPFNNLLKAKSNMSSQKPSVSDLQLSNCLS